MTDKEFAPCFLVFLLFLAALLLPAPLWADAAVEEVPPTDPCTFTVAYAPWPPYQENRNGRASGLDPDLARAIAHEAGCRLTFREVPWERGLKAIARGRLDMGLSVTFSEERNAFGRFTAPYRNEVVGLLVRKNDAEILTLKDLPAMVTAGKTLGVTRGYYYGPEVAALRKESPDSFDEAAITGNDIRKLAHGRLDGVLVDRLAGVETVKREGLGDQLTLHPMTVFASPVHLMLSRASTSEADVERLNAAIETLTNKGTLATIIDNY